MLYIYTSLIRSEETKEVLGELNIVERILLIISEYDVTSKQ